MEDLNKDDLINLLEWYSYVACPSCEDEALVTRINMRIQEIEELEAFQADCGDACKL